MGRKIRTGIAQKSHKRKKKEEETYKPVTYNGYIISLTIKNMPIMISDRLIKKPIEWHVRGMRGYEDSREDALKEAKKYIRKSLK